MKILRKFRLVVLFMLAAMLLVACGAVPVLPDGVPLTDAASFLNWLANPEGGGWLMVVFLVAWLVEYFPGWHTLKAWLKRIIMLAFAAAIAAGAQWLLASDVFVIIEPYLTPILKFVAVILAGEAAHRLDKGSNGSTVGKETTLK